MRRQRRRRTSGGTPSAVWSSGRAGGRTDRGSICRRIHWNIPAIWNKRLELSSAPSLTGFDFKQSVSSVVISNLTWIVYVRLAGLSKTSRGQLFLHLSGLERNKVSTYWFRRGSCTSWSAGSVAMATESELSRGLLEAIKSTALFVQED